MIVAVTMVRDEADIIATTIRHMAAQVDHVIVADNLSTDGTRDILERLPCEVLDDPEPAYWQSRKMTALAARAANHGATWVVPFDADEMWVASDRGRTLADVLTGCDATVAPAWLFNHVVAGGTMDCRIAERAPLHKVAARTLPGLVIEMGNHQATYPTGTPVTFAWDLIEVHHYPVRSAAQFIRKARQGAAALRLTAMGENVGQHWHDWDRLTDDQLADVFERHWCYDPDDPRLVSDPIR